MVKAEVGERLGGDKVFDKQSKEHEMYHGVPYELNIALEAEDRKLTQTEARRLAMSALQEWVNENPDHRVHYIQIKDMKESKRTALGLSAPAYEATAQITTSSPFLVAVLAATGIAALLAAAGAIGWGAVIATFIAAYAIFRAIDYQFGPTTFSCPKNPEHGTFEGAEDLAAHLAAMHPDQPETNDRIVDQAKDAESTSWTTVAMYATVGIGGAMVLSSFIGRE